MNKTLPQYAEFSLGEAGALRPKADARDVDRSGGLEEVVVMIVLGFTQNIES